MLLGRSRHELTNNPDRVFEVGSGDGEVYEASDYLLEPRQVEYLSEIGAELDGSIQRSRDGFTIGHLVFEEHTQHVMPLADQYAFGATDHSDPEEVMKVPQILHVERCRKLELHAVNFT